MLASRRLCAIGLILALCQVGCGDSNEERPPDQDHTTPGMAQPVAGDVGPSGGADLSDGSAAGTARPAPTGAGVLQKAARLVVERRFEEASVALDDAISSDPDNATACMAKARVLLEDYPGRNPDEAMDLLARIEDRRPTAKVWIAEIHLERGDAELADVALASFFDTLPEGAEQRWPLILAQAHMAKASAFLAEDQAGDVAGELEKVDAILGAASQSPVAKDPYARRWIGKLRERRFFLGVDVLLAGGEAEQAASLAQKEEATLEDDPRYHDLLARIWEARGDSLHAGTERRIASLLTDVTAAVPDAKIALDDVASMVEELEQLLGGYPRGRVLLARAMIRRGAFDQAIEECRSLRKKLEGDETRKKIIAGSWFVQGRAHYQKHQGKEAIDAYAKAARLEPAFQARYQELRRHIEGLMQRQAGGPADR